MKQIQWRVLAGLVVFAAFVPLGAGCSGAASGMTPSASVSTAIQGWERYFKIDWAAHARGNTRDIDGYIYNTYGSPAAHVQVLAQALDRNGNVVAQKLEWVPGHVPPLNRAYFRVAGLPPADQYRVSVWAFDWVQSPGMIER